MGHALLFLGEDRRILILALETSKDKVSAIRNLPSNLT